MSFLSELGFGFCASGRGIRHRRSAGRQAALAVSCTAAWLVLAGAAQAQAPAPAAPAAAPPAAAAPSVPVLDRLRSGGPLRIGYRESSIPFSYVIKPPEGSTAPVVPMGYAIDICRQLAAVVGKSLGLKSTPIEYVPVTSANRIPLVESGAVDLECGSTTNNAERRQRVAFTVPHFITGSRLLVKSDSNITRVEDMQGKRLVSTQGSTPLKAIEQTNRERLLRLNILTAPEHAKAVEMVEKGEADAFLMDDVLLFGLAANRPNPAALKVVGRFITTEPLAIMLNKNEVAFKKLVDDEMRRLVYSKEIHTMYDRWFAQPIPPSNKALNLPISYLLRDFWKFPTDKVPF